MYWYFDSYLCIRKKGKRHAYIICFCFIWFLPFHFCSLFIFYFVFNRRKKSWMCFLFVVCFPISVYIHSPMFASILFFLYISSCTGNILLLQPYFFSIWIHAHTSFVVHVGFFLNPCLTFLCWPRSSYWLENRLEHKQPGYFLYTALRMCSIRSRRENSNNTVE